MSNAIQVMVRWANILIDKVFAMLAIALCGDLTDMMITYLSVSVNVKLKFYHSYELHLMIQEIY